MKATLFVTLKREVLDPEGRAIQRAAHALGYGAVRAVRQGKLFEIELTEEDRDAAQRLLDELGERLLANPVIEDFRIGRIEKDG